MPDRFDDDDYLDELIRDAARAAFPWGLTRPPLDSEDLCQRVRLRIDFEDGSPWRRAWDFGLLLPGRRE